MARFDLNLLSALHALLTERNVTRAAEQLNLTQPTMSGMLQRLRYQFDDQLLVRNGRHMELTPFGALLHPSVLCPGWQLWQDALLGFPASAATIPPSITHADVQLPLLQTSPAPHVVPFAIGLHAAVLIPGWQLRHAFVGFAVPDA